MQLLFSFDRDMRVEKTLVQTLAYQLSCNSCSRLTGTCELRKLSCKLSLLNSHATLLVWPGHASWENSHVNSCLSTLMQLLFSFDRECELRKLSYKLLLINSHATLVLVWPGHASWENSHTISCFSTLMQLLFSFDRDMRVEKTLVQTLAYQLSCNSCSRLTGTCELRKLSYKLLLINSHATLVLVWPGHASWENSHTNSCLSTLMQLLFSFDRDMRVEKTLIQTLASQLSCNSCSRLTGTCELRKLSCKLSLLNSHATLLVWPGHASWENSHVNSCLSTLMQLLFSFDRDMRVEKTLVQTLAYQLSCNSCSRLTGTCELRKLSYNLLLLNSHATLVLVWPGHASWENSHVNSCLSTLMQLLFSFDRDMRVEKTLIQTLAYQLSCNSCSRLTGTCELRKLSCKLLLINSHATLVLVWPGHASWENSHTNSCLSTLMQLLFSFDRDMRVEKTLIQTLASQLSCNSCSRLTGTCELRKLSCKLLLINSHATLVLVWPGHGSWENSHTNSCLSTLMQLLFSFDRDMRVEKTLIQSLASQLSCNSCSRLTGTCELRKLSYNLLLLNSHATLVLVWPGHASWENSHVNSCLSTLMQLLFSFDRDMRVEKTLIQSLASQLSCNSCSRLTGTCELRKLSCKLLLINSHATLVLVWPGYASWENSHTNSCLSTLMQLLFSFDRDMRVEKTIMQTLAYQLSCNSCSRLTGTCELRKFSCKLLLINSHATLVLVWPGHASWENSHVNSCLSTLMQLLFSFDRDMRVEKTLVQTLAYQLSCNSCSRLTGTCELRKLSCKLSLLNSHATLLVWPGHASWENSHVNSCLSTLMQLLFSFDRECELRKLSYKLLLINSHATLVLVWPGHASWENSHTISCFSTLMQLLFSFDRDMRVEKTLVQTLAYQLSCNSCSRLTGTCELRKLSYKLLLINSHATLVLVWPGHASWENSHTNSCLSTLMQLLFSFDRDMRVEKTLIQTLASQLSCNSCSRLTGTCELRKLSCKLLLINSHATLVLVWPGHASWENSHTISCFSTLMQLLFSFDRDMRVEKTLM